MKIIVCYKVVYEEQDIIVKSDGSLSFERAETKISPYDLNAVEAAMQIVEGASGSVAALSAGDDRLESSKLKKNILSRGPSELFLVKDPALKDADTFLTASVLAAAARKIGFDLIICGEGSSDTYAQQVGLQLGGLLDLPVINAVNSISLNGSMINVERTLEDETETLEIPLPAVVCVTTDINVTRTPSMKEIIGAGKKPVTEWKIADLGIEAVNSTEIVSTLAPKQTDRKMIIIEGDSDENINTLYGYLRKEMR